MIFIGNQGSNVCWIGASSNRLVAERRMAPLAYAEGRLRFKPTAEHNNFWLKNFGRKLKFLFFSHSYWFIPTQCSWTKLMHFTCRDEVGCRRYSRWIPVAAASTYTYIHRIPKLATPLQISWCKSVNTRQIFAKCETFIETIILN